LDELKEKQLSSFWKGKPKKNKSELVTSPQLSPVRTNKPSPFSPAEATSTNQVSEMKDGVFISMTHSTSQLSENSFSTGTEADRKLPKGKVVPNDNRKIVQPTATKKKSVYQKPTEDKQTTGEEIFQEEEIVHEEITSAQIPSEEKNIPVRFNQPTIPSLVVSSAKLNEPLSKETSQKMMMDLQERKQKRMREMKS
jgi:hypothetical protein